MQVYSNCLGLLPPCSCSMQRYKETIASFMLSEEQTGGDVQELKRLSPWKVSDKDLEAIKPKVCVCVFAGVCHFEHEYNTSVPLTDCLLFSGGEDCETKRDHQEELHPRGSGCNVGIDS